MPEVEESSKKRRRTGFRLFDRQHPFRHAQKPLRESTQPPWMDDLLPSNDHRPSTPSQGNGLMREQSSTQPKKAGFQPFGWLFGKRSRRRSDRAKDRRQPTDEKTLKRSPSSFEVSSPDRLIHENMKPSASQRRDDYSDRRRQRSQKTESHSNGGSSKSNGATDRIRAFGSNRPFERRAPQQSRTHLPENSSSAIAFPPREASSRQVSQNSWLTKGLDTHIQAKNPTLLQQQTVLQQATLLQQEGRDGSLRRIQQRKPEPVNFTPRSRSMAIALYAARMLILSVGVGVLAGTVLSAWNPTNAPFAAGLQTIKQATVPTIEESLSSPASEVKLAQEMLPLKAGLQNLIQQNPEFKPGVFLVDLDSNDYLDLSGSASFSAASMIKVPILIAFFQDLDSGKIRLDEKLVMRQEVVAGGSGDLQYLPVGSQFTALDTATRMITISDNTATNMLVARLGGMKSLNQRFKSWGLSTTTLNKPLPDLQGTNTSSPKELASLMVRVSQGDLISLRSRDRMLDIMRRTVNNSQLPQGLGEGATIAHKTGDIGTLVGDVGLIDMPNGKRYATAVLIKRGFNDDAAYDLVQKISRLSYQHLSKLKAAAISPTATPAIAPKP